MDMLTSLARSLDGIIEYLWVFVILLLLFNIFMEWRDLKRRTGEMEKELRETTTMVARLMVTLQEQLHLTPASSAVSAPAAKTTPQPEESEEPEEAENSYRETLEKIGKGLGTLMEQVSVAHQQHKHTDTALTDINLTLRGVEEALLHAADQRIQLDDEISKRPRPEPLQENSEETETAQELTLLQQLIVLERGLLRDTWNMAILEAPKKSLFALSQEMVENNPFLENCSKLELLLADHQTLGGVVGRAMTPLRSFRDKMTQFLGVPETLKDGRTVPDDIQACRRELAVIRAANGFLNTLPEPAVSDALLDFKPEKWVRDRFLDFADRFLRQYNRDVLANQVDEPLEKSRIVLMEILDSFDINAVPIVLGETRFDSKVHIGRSYVNDPALPDGTVADVVKSGFVTAEGKTLHQPEVIVNRL